MSCPGPRRAAWVLWPMVCLTLSACSSPEKPPQDSPREPLTVSPMQREANPEESAEVVPTFLSFEQLTAGLILDRQNDRPTSSRKEEPLDRPLFAAELEPNNTAQTATECVFPALLQGVVHPLPGSDTGDLDWYTFLVELDHSQVLHVKLTPVPDIDLVLELYHDGVQGRQLVSRVDNLGPGEGEELPNFRLVNGRYYVLVTQKFEKNAAWNIRVPYRLEMTTRPTEAGIETEPNNSAAQAIELSAPGSITAVVNEPSDTDWYLLNITKLSSFSYLSVELLPPMGGTLVLTLRTSAREPMATIRAENGNKAVLPNLAVVPETALYYLEVSSKGKQSGGEYTLSVQNIRLENRMELEPDGTPEQALRLYHEEPMKGWFHELKDEDWYRIEPLDLAGTALAEDVPPALNIILSAVPGVDSMLEVLESDGETVLDRYDFGGRGEGEEIPNRPLPDRAVFLRVVALHGANPNAPYTLQARPVMGDGMEREPNDTLEEATPWKVSDGQEIRGYLAPAKDKDCFLFSEPLPSLEVVAPRNRGILIQARDSDGLIYLRREMDEGASSTVVLDRPGTLLCLESAESSQSAGLVSPYTLRLSALDF